MRDIVKPSIILVLICAVVTAALAFTYTVTADTIARRTAEAAEQARKEVMETADSFREVQIPDEAPVKKGVEIKQIFEALSGSQVDGYVFALSSKGYGGDIAITVGVDTSGKITGVNIGDNSETAGLGRKAAEEPFISQFDGIVPAEDLKVVKGVKSKDEEIQAVSGATITSKAVTAAVQTSIDTAKVLIEEGAVLK